MVEPTSLGQASADKPRAVSDRVSPDKTAPEKDTSENSAPEQIDRSPLVRGDIYLINLDPTIGSEIQKSRPCLIISPDEMHTHLRTALVAPMTTGSRAAPFRVPISFQGKHGLILLDEIRAIDKARLIKKMGSTSTDTLAQVLDVLAEVFAP